MKIVQLMSGGLDSVGQALLLSREGHEILPLYVKFRIGGGKQAKEINRTEKLSAIAGFLKPVIIKHRIRKEEYGTRDRQLVKIAADVAREKGFDAVAIATSYYPDMESVADIDWEDMNPILLEKAAGMKVVTLEMHKSTLLQRLNPADRELLFETTSCQLWWKKECGRCYRCAERHAAFLVVLGYDRTEYMHNPEEAKKWKYMIEQESGVATKLTNVKEMQVSSE